MWLINPTPVIYIEKLIDGDDPFELFWNGLPWEQREGAPRRECWFNPYDMPYTYGSGEHARTYNAHPYNPEGRDPASTVAWIGGALNQLYGWDFDCCFANGYATGRQHLGWHSDDSPEMDNSHPIATVSFGAEREIWFRRIGSKDEITKLPLANNSAAVMLAGMQQEWQHRIPKSSKADCGPRLSLTYRRLIR